MPMSSSQSSTASRSGKSLPLSSCSPMPARVVSVDRKMPDTKRTSRLNHIVLFRNRDLQCFKVVILVNVNVLMKDVFALTNEVEAFDGHFENA
jgi:hypothetical protein